MKGCIVKEIQTIKYSKINEKILYILRGVSGSGKSYKAKELLRGYPPKKIILITLLQTELYALLMIFL